MSGEPVTIAYYYRTRWGAHDEFVELFDRNHWPVLREQIASGRILEATAASPRFHGDGRADWDFLVTITYRDWAVVGVHAGPEIARRLYPDLAAHKAEETRRFSLLEAHWDVVLEGHALT
jgi:hypothetical protein